mgnify:CR=1 FL=1
MRKLLMLALCVAVAGVIGLSAGCKKKEEAQQPPAEQPKAEQQAPAANQTAPAANQTK